MENNEQHIDESRRTRGITHRLVDAVNNLLNKSYNKLESYKEIKGTLENYMLMNEDIKKDRVIFEGVIGATGASYEVVLDPGIRVVVRVLKNVQEHEKDEPLPRADIYNVFYVNGNCIAEEYNTLTGDLNVMDHRYVYVSPKDLFEEPKFKEYCEGKQTKPYNQEEVAFIHGLKGVINITNILQSAINRSVGYNSVNRNKYYFDFGFDRDKNMLRYGFSLTVDNKRVFITGDMKNASAFVYLKENTNIEIPFEDVLDEYRDSEQVQKSMEIIERLRELGVKVTYRQTRADKTISNKQTKR